MPGPPPAPAPVENRRPAVVEPLRLDATRREAAPAPRTNPTRQPATALKREPDLAPAARNAPPVVFAVPANAPAVTERAPREGVRGEGASARESALPPPKPRMKTVPRRASLAPTFVLTAILALVIGLSIYFGGDPGPDAPKAPVGRLAGEPSTNRLDDAGPERR